MAATGLPVSTAYRYLRLMPEHEFAVDRAGMYECGPLLADRSSWLRDYRGMVAVAGPLMERLTQATQETVTLAVRVGVSHVLCVHQTESRAQPEPHFGSGSDCHGTPARASGCCSRLRHPRSWRWF